MTALPCYFIWNPSMSPFSIFGFEVRYYSLCWIIGLMAGYLIMQHLYKRQKMNMELFEPLFMYCFLGILIGARLGHCIFYEPDYYFNHIPEMFLPMTVGQLLKANACRVKVLRTADKWFGVTYAADKPVVVAALAEKTRQGAYPDGLWK